MASPIDRVRAFITTQRAKQDQEKAGLQSWSTKIPGLFAVSEAMAAAYTEAGLSVLNVEKRSDQLLIYFGDRRRLYAAGADVLHLIEPRFEKGAAAFFQFNGDACRVFGFRYPFHDEDERQTLAQFVDLGDPEELDATRFGDAVAEFLEWASVGEGRGSGKIRF